MQGQYPGNRGVRLRGACRSAHHDAPISPAVSVRRLPRPGLICSCCDRGQIYCAGDCAARARHRASGRRTALPDQPPGAARACRSDASLSGARQESDASRFTRAAARMICWRPARRRSPATQFPGGAAPAHGFALPLVRPPLPGIRPSGVPAPPPRPSRPDAPRPDRTRPWSRRLTSKRRSCATTMSRSGASAPSPVSCTCTTAWCTRVLAQAGLPRIGPPARPSQIDAYLPFIRQTLETFPTLTASRLYGMVRERGYRGSPDHFRHLIACHRPRPQAEAYLRLRCLPGEQAQVDWGHFGHLADRPGTPPADGVRHGAEPRAPDLPALLPGRPDGELPARPCRGVHRVERCSACPAL